ncbi:hypothetical protein, partial [Escherichia coli]|uniref:hypothetical protein n=1 Tax=Escherichia coli TaxID=562 RepID=UPI0013D1C45D
LDEQRTKGDAGDNEKPLSDIPDREIDEGQAHMQACVELKVVGQRLDAFLDSITDDQHEEPALTQSPFDGVNEGRLIEVGTVPD